MHQPSPQQNAPANRRERTVRSRVAILQAALEEFAENGFVAARMEDIARRAGVAKGTIYLQFADKEALFKAIVQQEITPIVGAAGADLQPGETVRAFLDRAVVPLFDDFHRSERAAVIRLLIAEAARFPQLAELYYRAVVEPGLAVFGNLAQRAVETGEAGSSALVQFPQLFVAPVIMGLLWSGLFESYHHLDVKGMLRAYYDQLFLRAGALREDSASP